MSAAKSILFVLTVLCLGTTLSASGPVGIYGIIDKVVLEPNERQPERIQVWGAFAYVDGGRGAAGGLSISEVKRGYLYFRLPNSAAGETELREWNDLKSVAGTGQAVGFGKWAYSGPFASLSREMQTIGGWPHIFESSPGGAVPTDLRVRLATESPTAPAAYQTNAGMVKLSDKGSHAEVVKLLKSALAK